MSLFSTRFTCLLFVFACSNFVFGNTIGPTFSNTPIGHKYKVTNTGLKARQQRQIKAEPDFYCPDKRERGSFCSNNHTAKSGCTPLMVAAENGDLNRVRRLLKRRANVNATGPAGHTALILAANEGHVEVVKILLGAGADPNIRMYTFHAGEFSTLMSAMNRCNTDWTKIMDAMIAAGAEVNPKGAFSRSPLMYAIEKHDLVLIKALLTRGANANLKNWDGFTPLMAEIISSSSSIEAVAFARCRCGSECEN
jgi:ankyrin repeat protein